MDVSGAHTSGIERDNFLFNPGDVPLVFEDEFRFEFPVPVSWHGNLKLAVLTLKVHRGMAITLI